MGSNIKYEYMDEQIDEELKCTLCSAPFIDPISTSCRHAFCRRCINNKPACPECNQPLSSNDITPMAIFVCKMLDKLLVKCLNCGQTGIKRGQFENHIEEVCPKGLVTCSAADIRCPWKGRTKQLNLHRESCEYERLRPVLTELITENEKLKKENQSYQTSKGVQGQNSEDKAKIVQLAEENKFLRDLLFIRNQELEESIRRCPSNPEIDLRNRGLTDFDIGIIIQTAIIEQQCTTLQLQANKITDQSIPLLIHGLRRNTRIKKLNLSHNPISDAGVQLLANFIATNQIKLEKLYLCNIEITDQGVHYLAQMLKTNTTLESLGIFHNKFTNQGMEKLANVLAKYNKTLKQLYIQENPSITDASVDYLIDMLNSNQSLAIIDMESCGVNSDGIKRLNLAARKKANFKLAI